MIVANWPIWSVVGLLSIILLWHLIHTNKHLQNQLDQRRRHASHVDRELLKNSKHLLELRSVVVGLGQRITEQQELIKHLSERVGELEHVDTDARLYSRATKMVQLGAGIHELMEECELPKAEAELMMSLQNKLTGKEKLPPLTPMASRDSGRTRVASRAINAKPATVNTVSKPMTSSSPKTHKVNDTARSGVSVKMTSQKPLTSSPSQQTASVKLAQSSVKTGQQRINRASSAKSIKDVKSSSQL